MRDSGAPPEAAAETAAHSSEKIPAHAIPSHLIRSPQETALPCATAANNRPCFAGFLERGRACQLDVHSVGRGDHKRPYLARHGHSSLR